jgi:hypothetical protein
MRIVGIAYCAQASPRLSARGWVAPLDLGYALLDFNFTRQVGPVDILISTEGTITASIDIGPPPETPDDFLRWNLYAAHPTLAVGYSEKPNRREPLTLVRVSLVRINANPDTPPWIVEG